MSANVKRAIVYIVASIATALGIAFGLSSCSVVRTVTTESKCINRGDTVVQITTRTVENYTAEKQ